MEQRKITLMPDSQRMMATFGKQIKLMRLRRRISTKILSERAGISRATLWKIENGDPTVAMGCYVNVLHGMGGLDTNLLLVTKDEELDHQLEYLGRNIPKRVGKNYNGK